MHIIFATDRRIQSLTEDLLYLLASEGSLYQVRKLASMCGKIISLGNCVGSVTRLMTRNTFAVVNSASNWNSRVSVTPECINELSFWKDNVAQINGVPLWPVKGNRQRLFTLMHPIQPAGVTSNSWIKSFTKTGPISRPLRAPHFGSFLLFHCRYRRLPIPSVLKLLSGIQIIRTFPALWTLVLKFQPYRRWLLISIAVVSHGASVLICNGSLGTSTSCRRH